MSKTPRRMIPGTGVVFAFLLAPTVAHAETESHDSGEKPVTTVVTLDLYNLTDVHGHIEQVKEKGAVHEMGLSAMNCYLKQARTTDPNSSLTPLGGNIGASLYTSGPLKDNPTTAVLNTMPPLVSTIGDHELDMGQAIPKQHVDGSNPGELAQAGSPYPGTNIGGMGTWMKDGVEAPYPGDYEVWTSSSGVKVAFVGTIAENVLYKLSPGTTAGLSPIDPLAKIDALAKSIKNKNEVQIVIAMLDDDMKNSYSKVSEYVDGIMGGDTHVPYGLDKIDSAEKLDSKNPLLAGTTSGSYIDNLGLIRITYGTTTKKVLSADTQLIPMAKVAECGVDLETQAVVNQVVADSQKAGKAVVGTGYTQPFRRGVFTAPGGKTDPGSNRGIESGLGGFVADAMREIILVEGNIPADIGTINAGGLRDDPILNEDGIIAYAQPYLVMPFSNELGYVSITGADSKRAPGQQWKTDLNSQNSHPLPKLGISSNVRYTYDPAKPYGQHITSVMVNDESLGPTKVYTIGPVTFLLAGGDSLDAPTVGDPAKANGNPDRDKFNELFAVHSGVIPRVAKSSIGLSLLTEPLVDGVSLSIPVRGLSFSEGPSTTQNVTLSFDASKGSSPVDNSLLDEHASDEAAVTTTDGAGRTNVGVKASAGQCCEGHIEGDVVNVLVSVSTDLAEVVTVSQGLSAPVICPTHQVVPEPEGQQPTSGENNIDKPGKRAGKGPGNNLTKAGSSADALGLGALILTLVGAGMFSCKRAWWGTGLFEDQCLPVGFRGDQGARAEPDTKLGPCPCFSTQGHDLLTSLGLVIQRRYTCRIQYCEMLKNCAG